MQYQRSLSIEKRLQDVLELVRRGRYSTSEIAEQVGVSVPTISRDLTALRERGYGIRAERRNGSWYYTLTGKCIASGPAPRSREAVTA